MDTTKKSTKLTPEQEYKKELRRIKQFMSRASKRGFFWDESPVPKQPKKITTKSVERLRKITPDVLYKKGEYVVQETGEIISGTKGRNLERKEAAKKAQDARKAKQAKEKKGAKSKGKPSTKTKDKKKTNTKPKKETKPKDTKVQQTDEADSTTDSSYYPSFTDIVLSNFHAQLTQFPNAEGTPLLLAWFDRLIADNGREDVAQMLQDGAEQGIIITWETVYKSVNTKTYMTEMMRFLPDQGKFYSDAIMDMMEQFEWWEQPE